MVCRSTTFFYNSCKSIDSTWKPAAQVVRTSTKRSFAFKCPIGEIFQKPSFSSSLPTITKVVPFFQFPSRKFLQSCEILTTKKPYKVQNVSIKAFVKTQQNKVWRDIPQKLWCFLHLIVFEIPWSSSEKCLRSKCYHF